LSLSNPNRLLNFYSVQSKFTDPGEYASLYDDLPDDIEELCKVIRGLIIHIDGDFPLPKERLNEVDRGRYVSDMLACIMEIDDRPLTLRRLPEKRFIGCCRDFSILFCSMMRHRGIPTRTRCGFAPYINCGMPGFNVDHTIAEFWDFSEERWRLVDAEQDKRLKEINRIDFDTTDIPHDRFLFSGYTWQQYRENKVDPDEFGDPPDEARTNLDDTGESGFKFVGAGVLRYRVILDLAMMNKVELLLWDCTSLMELHIEPTEEDLRLLDRVAKLTLAGNDKFYAMRKIYETEPKLKIPRVVNSYSPVDKPRSIVLQL
jgi:hypothetical protein